MVDRATDLTEVKIHPPDLEAHRNIPAVKRCFQSYRRALEADIPMLMVDRKDLASLIAMSALWLEGK